MIKTLLSLVFLGCLWASQLHAEILPPADDDFPVKLVSVKPGEGSSGGVEYTWTYTGEPGSVFCVAFATSNRSVILAKQWGGRGMGSIAHADDRYSCATFDAGGRARVSVDVSPPPDGLLIGTVLITGGGYHTDVYRMHPKEAT